MNGEPVLIVGAGPTGLTLANELRRHGAQARIVERLARPSDRSRAIVVHSRTLEALDALGVADELISKGKKVHDVCVYAERKRILRIGFDELETAFPFVLCIPQNVTESVLRDRLVASGGHVEMGVELVGLEQEGERAIVQLRHEGGREETFAASFVVGADGAHSLVRKLAGIPFEGAPYEDKFLLADVTVRSTMPEDEISVFFTDEGPILMAPLPGGRTRLIIALPPASPLGDVDPTLEQVQALMDRRGPPGAKLAEPRWLAHFRIHHRLAPNYWSGRTFLAGDAAHIHSPAGGQGMNTGIQDAFNLAWKLALVIRGVARSSLLDSYHTERHAIAQGVIRGTDLATRVATLRSPVARAIRDHLGRFLIGLETVQHRILRQASGISLDYRKSPITGEHRSGLFGARTGHSKETPSVTDWRDFGAAPGPGDRAVDGPLALVSGETKRIYEVLRSPKHLLLLFDGKAATAEGYRNLGSLARTVRGRWGDVVTVFVVVPHATRPADLDWDGEVVLDAAGTLHASYGAASECLYAIRPDGYVGYRSQPAEAEPLFAWLESIFVERGDADRPSSDATDTMIEPARPVLEAADAARGEERLALLRAAATRAPSSSTIVARLGRALVEAEKWEDATTSLRRALALQPGSFQASLDLGTALRGDQRLAEALEVHERLAAKFPCEAATVALALDHVAAGEPEKALAPLQALAAKEREHKLPLARALVALGRFTEALSAIESVLDSATPPGDAFAAWIALAEARRGLARPAWIAAVEHACELRFEGSAIAHFHRGLARLEQGRADEARMFFARALELHPRFARAAVALARVHQERGELEAASAFLEQATRSAPWDDHVTGSVALFVATTGRGQLDLAGLEKRALARPHGGLAAFLGEIHQHRRDAEKAVTFFRLAAGSSPEDVSCRRALGTALLGAGRLIEAVSELRRAVALGPDHAPAWVALGAALRENTQSREAVNAFETAIGLAPTDAGAHYGLGLARLESGLAVEGVVALRRAVELAPRDVASRVALALALSAAGSAEAAEAARAAEWLLPEGHPAREQMKKLAAP